MRHCSIIQEAVIIPVNYHMGSLGACMWFWIYKTQLTVSPNNIFCYKKYPYICYVFLVAFMICWKYENILYCYRVSQNQKSAILGTDKNHKFTKREPESSNWSSYISGGSKNIWHFMEQYHWLSHSLITVLWLKKTEWTLRLHCFCS